MDYIDVIKEFSVVVYGNLERYNDVLSKARVRIFYKYGNRNGTYISDQFAEKLISTLPYVPIKGIYDEFNEDYTDHGTARSQGRIYGIVPANPNFSWELHLDEDGIEREYACADVLLYTALYEEAKDIIGKPQSMEIYDKSIQGEFKMIDGKKMFVFTEGCFLGLQVLGEETEPCFEGAGFYSLYSSLKDLIDELGEYDKKSLNIPNDNEGGKIMFNFKLSDDQKYSMLFDILNPQFNEEGGWALNAIITDVYDEYAVIVNMENGNYERVYYSKDDSEDKVEVLSRKRCYIVDVTEDEKQALATIQALNGGTYEKIDESFAEIENLKEQNSEFEQKNSEFEQKIEEQADSIATLTTERDELTNKFTQASEQIETLNQTINTLNEYKLTKETEEKQAIINKYADKLNEDIITSYKDNMSEFTLEALDKELAFELVKSNPSIFSLENSDSFRIPKNGSTHKSEIEQLLDKYENK